MTTNPPSLSQIIYARLRSGARTRSICQDYARYEAQKSIWTSQHPDAQPVEYEQAMRGIAKMCGV